MIFELGFRSVGSVTGPTVLLTIDTVLLGFIMAWLRLRSGSIWPTVLYHAGNNAFSGRLFEKLTIVSGVIGERVSKIVVELGVLLIILMVFGRPDRAKGSDPAERDASEPAPYNVG